MLEGAIHHLGGGGRYVVFDGSAAGSRLRVNTFVNHPSYAPFWTTLPTPLAPPAAARTQN